MEKKELKDRLFYEKLLWAEGFERIMGLDEVGRGCLAGPVVTAGVILPKNIDIPGIRDSKKLTKHQREHLAQQIKKQALYWVVKEGSIELIDRINILWASIETMRVCAETGSAAPDYLLIDGNRYTNSLIPYKCVVKGDDKSLSIAAASILAKVYRDNLMEKYHAKYPEFDWINNVGYPTAKHKLALKKFGKTEYHRASFKLGTAKNYSKP